MKKFLSIVFAFVMAVFMTSVSAATETKAAESEMKIKISAGDHVIHAVLYDNEAGRALWDKLPMTLSMMNLYGREMCYRFGNGGLPSPDANDTGYEIGDISYWPPAGSLVILYKQNGEVFEQQPIGHTDDDISFFEGMPTTDIVFEKDVSGDFGEVPNTGIGDMGAVLKFTVIAAGVSAMSWSVAFYDSRRKKYE